MGSILVREQTWVAHMISGLGVYGRQPMIFLSYLSSLPLSLKAMKKMSLGEDESALCLSPCEKFEMYCPLRSHVHGVGHGDNHSLISVWLVHMC